MGLIIDPDHPIEADSLLMMTFTNAAAAKLRADITERLAEEVRADPGNSRLRRQQMRLQRASIGTVDAFCLHLCSSTSRHSKFRRISKQPMRRRLAYPAGYAGHRAPNRRTPTRISVLLRPV